MAWTTPGTAVAGEVLTAAWLNTYVRDNLTELRKYQTTSAINRLTAGNLNGNSTSWAAIDASTDLTITASSGDVIEAGLHGLVGNQALTITFDIVTRASGSNVNSITSGTTAPTLYSAYQGSGWYMAPGSFLSVTGSCFYTLVAGDISSNQVTLRQVYATASAANRTIYANANNPWIFFVKNHGPAA